MMGLVTFSFTLLFVGAAAYTVSLPSLMKDPEGKSFVLLDAAGRTAGSSASGMWTSLFRQMMFGEDAAGGSSEKTGSGTGAGSVGSMTWISLSGFMSGTVADVETKKDEANSGQTPGSDADKTDPDLLLPILPPSPMTARTIPARTMAGKTTAVRIKVQGDAAVPLHAGDELRLGASTVFAVVEGTPERWA